MYFQSPRLKEGNVFLMYLLRLYLYIRPNGSHWRIVPEVKDRGVKGVVDHLLPGARHAGVLQLGPVIDTVQVLGLGAEAGHGQDGGIPVSHVQPEVTGQTLGPRRIRRRETVFYTKY